jgi:hypothetical protein
VAFAGLVCVRVARLFLLQHTKMGKNIPNNQEIYQMSIKLANGRKIYRMDIKYINIFFARHSRIYPNLDFWFENIPSGNPALCRKWLAKTLFAWLGELGLLRNTIYKMISRK